MACSRPLPPLPIESTATLNDQTHNTMEVDQARWLESDINPAPIVGHDPKDEKALGYDDDKILSFDTGKIISYDDVGKEAVVVQSYDVPPEHPPVPEDHLVLGLRRRTFRVVLLLFLILVLGVAIGGGVVGSMAKRNEERGSPPSVDSTSPAPSAKYANTGLAAIQWTDPNGTLHKRVYYQDSSNKIQEAAWDNTAAFYAVWNLNNISDPVKPSTPIAAAAGYPHASLNYSLVLYGFSSQSRQWLI